ncbi:MFS transporter [Cognatiluteimonas profundi]|uniref:MFS transporter n=1 Tax=Cognatiluteimonas profundi TaxID=2594501 RepID=UPI00131B043B|nr:MFS transporter [Lysobacter profundi]
MKPDTMSFHHPVAFWVGCLAVVAGVFAHMPMFLMGRAMHWQLVGMPMTPLMLAGMALIPAGLLLSTFGLMPRLEQVRRTLHDSSHLHFHIADGVPLNREHWKLVAVLVVALAIDVMKPATLGFVVPGMSAEYVIPKPTASLLALVALIGTTVGSVVWGRLADVFGRRAAILLSALMFMGTAICGAMPAFGWNLVMCFLMGASAGGLLPITFTLMAETIPSAHRGWLLVALGGVGTSAGYLLAAGSASLLEPMFSWRVLWLLGLPTGAIILFLNRYIPESPRFLSNAGYEREARAVLRKFAGDSASDAIETDDAQHPGAPVIDERHPVVGMRQLLRGRHARITWGLVMCGIAWGLVNFGFVLWLPVNLAGMGVEAAGVSRLLALSAVLALPGIGVVIWLYHRWSSFKSLVLFIGLTTLALLAFFAMGSGGVHSQAVTMAATVALLVSVSGVIAMLIPYAAEIYPVHLRGTGSGVIAASSKFGGILGAGLGVLGFFGNFALSAVLIAVPMAISGVMLWRSGIETRGQGLEDIQDALQR